MASYVPTLPDDTTEDKRVQISSRQRVDVVDFVAGFGGAITGRIANWLRSLWADEEDFVIHGFVVKQQGTPDMSVRVTPEAGRNYSAAMQSGYLMKHALTTETVAIDTEPSGSDRFDLILARYIEQDSDQQQEQQLTQPTITKVEGEDPGTGDGTTYLYNLVNSGIIAGTSIALVNGAAVAHSIVPKGGPNGEDQIAFADPPPASATIAITYYWMSGGKEQQASLYTRFVSKVELSVLKGTPGAGVPSTPAGFMKLAEVGPLNSGVSTVTDSIITKTREFVHGPEANLSVAGGSFKSFLEALGFIRNGLYNTLDLLQAKTLLFQRTAHAQGDRFELAKFFDRASTTESPLIVDPYGRPFLNAKHFRDDFMHSSLDSAGTDTSKLWRTDDSVGTPTIVAHGGSVRWGPLIMTTGGTSNNSAIIRSHARVTPASSASFGLSFGKVVARFIFRLTSTADIRGELGIWASATQYMQFLIEPTAQINGTSNWVANFNSSGDNFVNTDVAADTNWHLFELVRTAAAGSFLFFIDKVLKATITATLVGTDHRMRAAVITKTTASKGCEVLLAEATSQALF